MTAKRKVEYKRTLRLFKGLLGAYATPPEMTVSQWADAYRVLSPEASAERGRWRPISGRFWTRWGILGWSGWW